MRATLALNGLRGPSEKINRFSLKSKLLPDFCQSVLKNIGSKKRLIELLFEYVKSKHTNSFELKSCKKILLNTDLEGTSDSEFVKCHCTKLVMF